MTCFMASMFPNMMPGAACEGGKPGTCQASGDCQVSGGASSDPVITGFDGRSFHYDQTGNFTLLSSGDDFKTPTIFAAACAQVDVTFAGASTEAKEEKCWTSSVCFVAPNVTSTAASTPAQVTLLSSSNPSKDLADMTVNAVLSDSGDTTGCQVTTATMQATVYQVSGYEQAAQHPEEALNTDIKLTKPLPAPVTGILGATYPVDEAAEAEFLRALEEPAGGVEAGVVGETGSRRQLASTAGPFFLHSSLAVPPQPGAAEAKEMETKLQMMRSAVSDFREDVGSGDAQAELQKHTLPGFEVGPGVQSAAEGVAGVVGVVGTAVAGAAGAVQQAASDLGAKVTGSEGGQR
ncbi:hypothetical protein N2152v2_008164 [Parachlorella kessleri]